MKRTIAPKLAALALCACAAPPIATADDIDIFTGASAGAAINPHVLIVLDNTSNWARQSQQWPGGLQQGQSEANAIKTVLGGTSANLNLGLMEFVTGGNANDDGGFIRSAIKPMNGANQASFATELTTIYNNITDPNEKRNANTPYGNLMYDAYNYYAGANAYSPSAVVASKADSAGYVSNYTQFASPLTRDETCGKNFLIFIGNPNASGPRADSAANTAALAGLGGVTSQLGLPNFSAQNSTTTSTLGNTAACYASAADASAGLGDYAASCASYTEGCAIGAASANTSPIACPTGALSYTVVQSVYTPAASTVTAGTPVVGAATSASAPSLAYYNAAGAVPTSEHGGLDCPATTSVTSGDNTAVTTYSCGWTVGAAVGNTATTIATGVTSQAGNTGGAGCYSGIGSGSGQWNLATTSDFGGMTCPANHTCNYTGVYQTSNADSNCTNSRRKVNLTQARTPLNQYTITRTATPTTVNSATVTTPASTVQTTLGKTAQCYASAPASTGDFAASCGGANVSCTYNNAPTSATLASCPAGSSVYAVVGTNTVLTDTATGGSTLDTAPYNADEWARFLHDKGVPVADSGIRPSVTTYTIDVYNKQPNATHTALLMSMAKAGGGKYFAARDEQAIVDALKQILVEIQAVNTSFASTSLPVNATNRSQNENQVFIGMFRPDPDAKPRWFGNLKRYQLIGAGAEVELGDVSGAPAVNSLTGFVTPCATSYWTGDSGAYWGGMGLNPDPAGTCTTSAYNAYSDAPDGPQVEKGAVAQVLRQGNTPSGTGNAVNRTMYTLAGAALSAFNAASSGLDADLVSFIQGQDVNDEKGAGSLTTTRPSIHGDVIHSRPLPVNYGAGGVTVYYGANDGTLRAVDAASGQERWAFVAPEFFPRLARLKDNSPMINYPNINPSISPTPTPKDYFFDGSTGVYQNADNSRVWIFPTMRRGGRMLYGIDVSAPAAPRHKWRAGCPNLGDDSGCTTGMTGIGQTWSTPAAAFIKGYSTGIPVLAVGGGYDSCEDADSVTPNCAGTKGGFIYILDADSGALIRSFATARAVAADIALVDIDNDGYPDYAYGADTGGNLYRVDFIDGPLTKAPLASGAWTSRQVAYTSGGYRKFQFAPALLAAHNKVYAAIGSGDREHPLQSQYPYLNVINRFYLYKDDLSAAAPAQDLDALENYSASTTCASPPVLPDSALKGWFMNLNQYGRGEQVVTTALIAGGMVTFSTNRPIEASAGTCASSLGEARGYWVNLLNASGAIGVAGNCGGNRSSAFVGGGLPPSPVLATSVPVGGRAVTVVIGAVQKNGGASVAISPQKIRPTISSKRKRAYRYTSGN